MAVAMLLGTAYVLSGTKYVSLRVTYWDSELQSLQTTISQERNNDGDGQNKTNATTTTAIQNDNNDDCFWYSDNLYHLMCAVLTNRPIQFHSWTNRVPKMQRELFQLLNVRRCVSTSALSQQDPHRGAGWEDVQRNLPQVRQKLRQIQEQCQEFSQPSEPSTSSQETTDRPSCLHLARNFNRRLQNCSEPLERLCDRVVFDDTLSFCSLWNVVQEYHTIVSPHGFQLVLPILARVALEEEEEEKAEGWSNETGRQASPESAVSTGTAAHIVEIGWRGYGDPSYQQLTTIFGINHTLLYGVTPNGKLNTADNDCVKQKKCRKSERKRDLFCTLGTQLQLNTVLPQGM